MASTTERGYGYAHRQARQRWKARIDAGEYVACWRCGKQLLPGEPFDLGHDDVDRSVTHGPECRSCNRATVTNLKARMASSEPRFLDSHPETTPQSQKDLSLQVDPRLAWQPADLRRYPWLADLADVPDDASPPLMMTPVPSDAVGSYGEQAVAWIEKSQRITLRWWQRLTLIRQLEHRADGTLCWRKKIESAPRRAGKSVGLKGHALWRLENGARLFGEVQTIIHTGSDMAICREIQRGAWRWSEGHGWTVTRGNGKEAIETPGEDRWLVRAQDAVYGYDVCVGMVDEGWNVKPDTVSEGLEPATLERRSPQLILTSTAHRRATSLMRSELTAAMSLMDPETLLLLWAAPMGSDPSDPAVWRAASPYWSEDRRKLIASKYAKAAAGEDDPEFDDPDPMKGFEAQYLNIWRVREPKQAGRVVIESDAWAAMVAEMPNRAPDAVAVESWFDEGVSVARAWANPDGPAVVSVTDCADVAGAVALAASYGAPLIRVGASLMLHPGWAENGLIPETASGAVRAVVAEFAQALKEHRFKHARSGSLTEQVLALRVAEGADGFRVVSKSRADAVKAATWAVQAASSSVFDPINNIW